MSQKLEIYLKFCEFEGRICVGRVHSQDISVTLPGYPPPAQTTVFTKVSGVGLVTGVLTVKFVLILSTGVLQTQAGMEGSK